MSFIDIYSRVRSNSGLKKAWRVVHAARAPVQGAAHLTAQMTLAEQLGQLRATAEAVLGLRPFDVQLLGAVLLSQGKLAEMRTGEGKTLTVALGVALLAAQKRKVHVATANDYLARRDEALMRPLFQALGLTSATVSPGDSPEARRAAYATDVVYSTGSELGFDFLKNNLVKSAEERTQGPLDAVIIDEVDSILIDDARTPLIIAGSAADQGEMFLQLAQATEGLTPDVDYRANQKERYAELTDQGYAQVEARLVAQGQFSAGAELYRPEHLAWAHALHSMVKARALYRKNRDYLVRNNEVLLVDVGTGRALDGRRLENGLHEAIEALEGLTVNAGSVTQASITYQSFFKKYQHLAGLTGTAATDAEEFLELYGLDVVVVPPNKPLARKHLDDLVFASRAEKLKEVTRAAAGRAAAGQPVLVGCTSVRDAELVSQQLTRAGVTHNVLTAKHIEDEARIIAEAGVPGTVTVATNMAGRGTDIILGGHTPDKADFATLSEYEEARAAWALRREAAVAAGGLFVLGTERNGLRRVDLQLAGRSGRQGDPGTVQFYLSVEDELLKVFGASPVFTSVRKMVETGGALSGGHVTRLVELAQKKVEEQGFAARKNLLKFESVMAQQRDTVYEVRRAVVDNGALSFVQAALETTLGAWLDSSFPEGLIHEELDVPQLRTQAQAKFGTALPILRWVEVDDLDIADMREKAEALIRARMTEVLSTATEAHAKDLVLGLLDTEWQAHLGLIAEMQDNLSLKGHMGASPVHEFGTTAFARLAEMVTSVQEQVTELLLASDALNRRAEADAARRALAAAQKSAALAVADAWEQRWVGRNDPCPCGSGSRYKDCHGRLHS